MFKMRTAVAAGLAIGLMCSAAAIARDMDYDSSRIADQLRKAHENQESSEAAIAIEAGEIVKFEGAVASFEVIASQYETSITRYFTLRARYFQRVRYELGHHLDPLIVTGNRLDEDLMNAYSLNSEIIERTRELVKRGRANALERALFRGYWNIDTQATLQAGLASLNQNLQGTEKEFGFEQIVQGVENDDIGRAMLGLPMDAAIEAQAEARAAAKKVRKHRRHSSR